MDGSSVIEEKKFNCIRCGCCCKNIKYYEPASFLDDGTGVCKYYDDENKACKIYDFRPDFCRVDKMYKQYKDKMTWNEYVDANREACEELRRIEKKKILNIGKEVVSDEKEDVKVVEEVKEEKKIKNDWYENKIVIEKEEIEDYMYDDDEDFFS